MNLSGFLAQNALPVENIKFVVSKRFLDEKGNPYEWEIRALSEAENESLRRACATRVPIPGKKNLYQKDTDYDKYLGKLAAACTVFPDLNSEEMQNSYGVMGAENLLKAMLTNGEYEAYLEKVQEVCGFGVSMQDQVDEAKN